MIFEDYLGIKQSQALYRNMRTLAISSVFVNVLLVLVMWPQFTASVLIGWLAIACSIAVGRWWTTRDYTELSTTKENYRARLLTHTAWSTLNGLVWGAAALFFQDPEAPIYSVFLICALTGYVSVTLLSNTLYLPQFYGFVLSCTIAFVFSYLILGGGFYAVLCGYAILYTAVMIVFGRIANKNYVDAKRLEFENSQLLQKVTSEKQLTEKAITEKSQFLAATSHDLRQPLHALGLYVDALEPMVDKPQAVDIVNKIRMSSQALYDLLHGLLDISRLDADAVAVRLQHLPLSAITERLLNEISSDASDSGLHLQHKVSEEHFVYTDPTLLARVIQNLLSNALKYTNKGSISIVSRETDENIELDICDTGIGVPAEQLDYIFSEFTQLQNPERDRSKGLGLGLSIVRRLCALLNTEYRLTSEVGAGTKVTLLLTKGEQQHYSHERPSLEKGLQNLTILFVDDEQAIRDAMALTIQGWQCTPLIASDKTSALAELHRHDDSIDLVIADLRLRDQSTGLDVIRAVREELNQEIPAILVTGDTATDRLEMVKRSDIELMHKPLRPKVLHQQISQLILAYKQMG